MGEGLLYAGIDEAGYGPRLGPLCVGLAVFRVHDYREGDPAPDLWKRLSSALSRKPRDAKQRIAIADSKVLKLSNQLKRTHPLCHLERGVLAMQEMLCDKAETDTELFDTLGVSLEPHEWYDTDATPLPLACDAGALRLDGAMLRRAMADAGIELVGLRCACVGESSFNTRLREVHTKAEVVCDAVSAHLRTVFEQARGTPARVICDRLSGRARYADLIASATHAEAKILEESSRCSRYATGQFGVQFLPEGERKHLPIALASMVAKFVRELAMIRFNRYWSTRRPEIKPTAGYWQDANRWLREMEDELNDAERRTLVRLA